MANLRTNNLSGEQGQNAIKGSVVFGSDDNPAGLRIEDNSELELGSETNWTIEFWIFLNGDTHGDYDVVLGKGSGSGNNYEYYVEIMSDNTLDFLTTTAGTAWDFQQQISPVLSADSWHHIAIVRNGSGSNSLKSYVNGQEYGSFTAQNIHTSSYPFGIGYYAGLHAGLSLAGNSTLSNVRIVKGTSVYTANFTPPFHELTAIPNTVLLCCQDSDNPLKEETGKTITGFGRYEYLNDEEVVLNGTFDTDTSNWTTQGDTVEIDNQRLKIIRSGTFGAATQQINARLSPNTQYKFRGRIEQSGSPGSALIRLSSASNGNGTIFFNGAYGTGVHETIFTYSSGGGFYVSAIAGNGNVTGIFDDISVKAINPGTPPKNIPPYGVDAGNTFGGPIQQSSQGYMYFPTGRTEERGRGRGLFNGGGGPINTIQYIEIQSQGNAIDFGDLTLARDLAGSAASSVRGLVAGGYSPTYFNTIDFVTIATTSNATDFGDLLNPNYTPGALSSNIRAVFGGGATPGGISMNTIQFVTIATTGDATDFGDLTVGRRHVGGLSSPTRGVYGAGAAPGVTNVMDFITIASTGDATDFGDMTETKNDTAGCSNATRGLFIGGDSGTLNTIEFITIATTGNGTDFGDLPAAIRYGAGLTDTIRGVFTGGGAPGGTNRNSIDFVIIETTGNAQDFGDLITALHYPSACSDSHGGLS